MTDNFDFDVSVVQAAAKSDQLKKGLYPFLLRRFELKEYDNGHKYISYMAAPMQDPEDVQSAGFPTMFDKVDLPDGIFDSKEQEMKGIRKLAQKLSAMLPDEIQPLPVKDGDGNFRVNGEVIDKREYDSYKNDTFVQAAQRAVELAKSPSDLKELSDTIVVWAQVFPWEFTGDDGEPRSGRSLIKYSAEQPANSVAVAWDDRIDYGDDASDEADVEEEAPQPKKKASKKKGKK